MQRRALSLFRAPAGASPWAFAASPAIAVAVSGVCFARALHAERGALAAAASGKG
jgi:hypothetical protein